MQRLEKVSLAIDGLRRCLGRHGVWAAEGRYAWQLWMRDFGLAILPLLMMLGWHGIALTHLRSVARRQRQDGKVPILFLDGWWGTVRFLFDKIVKSIRAGEVSFMLRRFWECRGDLGDLTPGTRDSEIIYVLAVGQYIAALPDRAAKLDARVEFQASVHRALGYIEQNLMVDGLVVGADWRDTLEKTIGDKTLLSVNCMLVQAYRLNGQHAAADALKDKINKTFWSGDLLQDWPGNPRFDPFGASLAVLFDVVDPERYGEIFWHLSDIDTAHGVTIQCRHNPFRPGEAEVIDRTDGVVVWPWISHFVILALMKMAARYPVRAAYNQMAQEQFDKLVAIDGFAEWYDPADGSAWGAADQLWSKVMLVRAYDALARG